MPARGAPFSAQLHCRCRERGRWGCRGLHVGAMSQAVGAVRLEQRAQWQGLETGWWLSEQRAEGGRFEVVLQSDRTRGSGTRGEDGSTQLGRQALQRLPSLAQSRLRLASRRACPRRAELAEGSFKKPILLAGGLGAVWDGMGEA